MRQPRDETTVMRYPTRACEPAVPNCLRLATFDEVSDALAHALRSNGRKRPGDADEMQARVTAGHLLRCLEMSGFVLMRRPPLGNHWAEVNWAKPSRLKE